MILNWFIYYIFAGLGLVNPAHCEIKALPPDQGGYVYYCTAEATAPTTPRPTRGR